MILRKKKNDSEEEIDDEDWVFSEWMIILKTAIDEHMAKRKFEEIEDDLHLEKKKQKVDDDKLLTI